MMAEPKTAKTGASAAAFLKTIDDDQKRKDCKAIAKLMKTATGSKAEMWGPAIVGFGKAHIKYANGKTGEWMQIGFAPRKSTITLYIMNGFSGYKRQLTKLGKYKTGKSCLYIRKLADVDVEVLEAMINDSVAEMAERHP